MATLEPITVILKTHLVCTTSTAKARQAMEYRDEKLLEALKGSIVGWKARRGCISVNDITGALEFDEGHEPDSEECPLCILFGWTDGSRPDCTKCPLPCCYDTASAFDDIMTYLRKGESKKLLTAIDHLIDLMCDARDREAAKPEKDEYPNRIYEQDLKAGKTYHAHSNGGITKEGKFVYLGKSEVDCCGDARGEDYWIWVCYHGSRPTVVSVRDMALRVQVDGRTNWVSYSEADQGQRHPLDL